MTTPSPRPPQPVHPDHRRCTENIQNILSMHSSDDLRPSAVLQWVAALQHPPSNWHVRLPQNAIGDERFDANMGSVDGLATQPLTVPVCSGEVSKMFQAAWTQSSNGSCFQCLQSNVTNAMLPLLFMPKQMAQLATVSGKVVMLQEHWPMCSPSIRLHTAAAPK